MKLKSHVDQFKALSIFTRNNFKDILNQSRKPGSQVIHFNIYIRPTIEFCNIWWDNSSPSSLLFLCWNAVKVITSSKYGKFFEHVFFALLNFPSPQSIFFGNVFRFLTSVACDRSLNLWNLDKHLSVCRKFLRYFNCKMTRGNDGLTESLFEFC